MLRLALVFTITTLGLMPAFACTGKLGVSRTITMDTTGGQLHGNVQYKTKSLLKEGEVVLTFDDGPLRATTRKVLAALKDHCTKATFFMVGRMAVANPAMVREVAAAGHTIASHTWSHKNLHRWSSNRGKGEIELGISTIQQALGKPIAPFFRFPYLADPKAMIAYNKKRNIAVFSIDVDSRDFRTRSGSKMRYTVMRQLKSRKKGIILLHDIQISTARGIQSLLDELYREGYKVVHFEASNTIKTLPAFDRQAAELHAKRRYASKVVPVNPTNEIATNDRPESNSAEVETSSTANQPGTQPATSTLGYQQSREDDWRRRILGN